MNSSTAKGKKNDGSDSAASYKKNATLRQKPSMMNKSQPKRLTVPSTGQRPELKKQGSSASNKLSTSGSPDKGLNKSFKNYQMMKKSEEAFSMSQADQEMNSEQQSNGVSSPKGSSQ